ncbi:pentapeptide repeat-containing protein [Nocardia abscessus]|uniref:pentapeptide repeat-containing protein n=1 Tax=Nocardia abscessus TaxID=120957 RepID=UPI002B4B51AD|nr:pentapeptide repeat-containing protein [Nocardia abscessus]
MIPTEENRGNGRRFLAALAGSTPAFTPTRPDVYRTSADTPRSARGTDSARTRVDTDLPDANPSRVYLTRARLYIAGLSGAPAHLRGVNLSGIDLAGVNLAGADLARAFLGRANLRGANLFGASLFGASLRDADLRDANLRDANLSDANLNSADLRGADLSGANLNSALLHDALLHDALLNEADLRGANLRGANLRGADLGDANLNDVDLRDANLSGTYLPQLHRITELTWSSGTSWGRDTAEIRAHSIEQSAGVYILNPPTGQQAGTLADHAAW